METRSLLLLFVVCAPWSLLVHQVDAKTFHILSAGQSLSNFTFTLHGIPGLAECVFNCQMIDKCFGGRYMEATRECKVVQSQTKPGVQSASKPVGSVDFVICCKYKVFDGHYLNGFNEKIFNNTQTIEGCQWKCGKYNWCISADYKIVEHQCYLHKYDRRSKPSAFTTSSEFNHFEKVC